MTPLPFTNPTLRSGIPVIILGGGISALGVQRVLARRGIPYRNAVTSDPLLRRSRFFRPIPRAWGESSPESFDGWLAGLPVEKAVLVPCSDRWALAAAALHHMPSDRFPASLPHHDTLDILVDKGRFLSALMEFDIPHPWTRIVGDLEELDQLPDHRFVDVFLKPRDSQLFMERSGVKALRVSSREDARGRLSEVLDGELRVMLQEYVPGPPDRHYFIDGFVDGEGRIRALLARRRLRMYPPDFGNSSYMVTIPLETVEGAVASLRRLLGGIGHRGIFSAEFKQDPRDQIFKILEVNARAWWYIEFAAQCGVDVCHLAYRDALGLPLDDVFEYPLGVRCVYPYHDFYACSDLRSRGSLSLRAWISSWIGARQPVFQWADPWPGLHDSVRVLVKRLSRPARHR